MARAPRKSKTPAANPSPTRVLEVAVNLDDVSPQVIGDLFEQLLEHGALDVWTQAIHMKKQRPGTMLCLLCEASKLHRLTDLIFRSTGTLGLRYREWSRLVLRREFREIATPFGKLTMKLGYLRSELITAQPEFADAQRLARLAGVPVRSVLAAARAEMRNA